MLSLSRSFPWLVLALASTYLVAMMAPAENTASQMQLQEFAKIPVVDRGRVKIVEPKIVLEVAFDAVTRSPRHASGYALRFPRIKRIRDDKTPEEINTVEDVANLFVHQGSSRGGSSPKLVGPRPQDRVTPR